MKKLVLVLAVILGSTALTTAQKSSKILSGTVSYTKATDVKASYTITPLIGYFVTNKVAVGVLGEYGKTSTVETTNVGVFGRCHFMNIGKNCQVFSQVDLTANSSEEAGVKTKSTSANLGLGANYTLTKKLDLTMHAADLINYEIADSKSITTIGFSGINNPFAVAKFGVIYKF